MMMGISYREFWGMNPHVLKFYAELYKKPMFQIEEKPGEITEKDIQKAIMTEQKYMAMAINRGLPETIIK